MIDRYHAFERAAWREFDGIVAINREEQSHVRAEVEAKVPVFYAPMGTDLTRWPYSWSPAHPLRVGYYGALGNQHNERAALRCFETVMPAVWREFPDAELWLVGSQPSERLRALTTDARVKVTGFIPEVQPVLATMTTVLCPWSGTYGFRSRLVEVMALGVPVVVTPDAVSGMELDHGKGSLLATSDADMVQHTMRLLREPTYACEQSKLARDTVVRLFSLENTYGRLVRELESWLAAPRPQ
jgi:glycosyltransferase involved in cell wall biosynthesis